jgi:hypothetical protein
VQESCKTQQVSTRAEIEPATSGQRDFQYKFKAINNDQGQLRVTYVAGTRLAIVDTDMTRAKNSANVITHQGIALFVRDNSCLSAQQCILGSLVWV